MGPVLTRIQEDYLPTLDRVLHPLVGSPTLNVSTIHGGTAQNVVPAECVIWVDRRVNPGESHQEILADIDRLLETLGDGSATIERRPPTLATAPLDTPSDHPLVSALKQGREQITGNPGQVVGMTFGTDASFISPVGIPCVVFGPGSIDQAHSDDEWVEIEQVAQAAESWPRQCSPSSEPDQLSGMSYV